MSLGVPSSRPCAVDARGHPAPPAPDAASSDVIASQWQSSRAGLWASIIPFLRTRGQFPLLLRKQPSCHEVTSGTHPRPHCKSWCHAWATCLVSLPRCTPGQEARVRRRRLTDTELLEARSVLLSRFLSCSNLAESFHCGSR